MATTHGGQVGIRIDAKAALVKIGRIEAAFGVRELLQAIGDRELRWTTLNIGAAGKVEGGEPFAHMAEMTLRMRPRRTSPFHFSSSYQQLLQQSMTVQVDEGAATVSVGTNARHALKQHMGDAGPPRLPARKLVATASVARQHALEVVKAIVDSKIGGVAQ